ncbi:MAG TPA: DUF192 domain-containing protein [Acidimicrobiales bacterium]|nr:DUF192 domain-containing protein [Acidimicrobiales bacterium]
MAWLLRTGDVLASLELARSPRRRVVGLVGRRRLEGGLLIEPCRAVHTIGMRFPIDVAYLDRAGVVIAISSMRPNRLGLPRRRARSVLEAEAGAFARWRLVIGDTLEIRE